MTKLDQEGFRNTFDKNFAKAIALLPFRCHPTTRFARTGRREARMHGREPESAPGTSARRICVIASQTEAANLKNRRSVSATARKYQARDGFIALGHCLHSKIIVIGKQTKI